MGNKLERKQMKIYASNPTKPTDIIAYGSDIVGPRVNTTDPDQIQTAQYEKGVRTAVVGKRSTSLQNRQTLDYLFSRALKYLFQMGVAEWLATEEYFIGSVASDGKGGLFVSNTDNNIGNALSNTTHWSPFPTAAQLAEKVNKAGDTMTGDLIIKKSQPILRGAAPIDLSNVDGMCLSLEGKDKNNKEFARIDLYRRGSVQQSEAHLIVFNTNGQKAELAVFINDEGAITSYAPTPLLTSNNTEIATTAFVKGLIKDYVTESLKDDNGNWYRKYKSGWLEQGGIFSHTSANPATISLLKAFANTNYTIVTTSIRDGSGGSSARNNVGATGKTTTSFKVYGSFGAEGSSMWPIYWTAFGKGA